MLSKLQSVSGWRGSLVDHVISTELIRSLSRGQPTTKRQLLTRARARFDRQLSLALRHAIRDPALPPSDRNDLVAFRAVEYGQPPVPEEIERAWEEIERALANLFALDGLRQRLHGASTLIAQRPLQFAFSGVNVRAVPDLIAFYPDTPPLIVDWKVHVFGSNDYRLQLALYAMALLRCKPHRDFPDGLHRWTPTDLRLVEAQLLTAVEREYALSADDCAQLEDYIAASASEMLHATSGLSNGELCAEDFAVTSQPSLCQRCSYQRLCWERSAVDA